MREVGVHLADELRAGRERVREAGQVRLPEAALGAAPQHLDDAQLGADALGDLGRAVGGAVVDDEDAVVAGRRLREHVGGAAQQPLDRGGLVVGGDDDPDGRRHGAPKRRRRPRRARPAARIRAIRDHGPPGMRLIDVIRGPSRPTQVELRRRRRRAGALAGVAGLALLLGMIAGAGGGRGTAVRAEGAQVGWYGHLRMLAGAGRRSLDVEARTQESAAIDRALKLTPFVRLAGSQHRLVALTFDDGPGPYTDGLLSELRQLRVPATFFVVGYQLPDFGPQLQREVDLGVTIGDHTRDHRDLALLSARDQRSQVLDDALAIRSYGAPYPRLFRPPYGSYDATTLAVLGRQRMLAVLWSVDSEDYTSRASTRSCATCSARSDPARSC